jgi:hypothetical protein
MLISKKISPAGQLLKSLDTFGAARLRATLKVICEFKDNSHRTPREENFEKPKKQSRGTEKKH